MGRKRIRRVILPKIIWKVPPSLSEYDKSFTQRITFLFITLILGFLSYIASNYLQILQGPEYLKYLQNPDAGQNPVSVINLIKNMNLPSIMNGTAVWFVTFVLSEIWNLPRKLIAINVTFTQEKLHAQREKYLRAILLNSTDPYDILKNCLDKCKLFDINKIEEEVRKLDEGDTIYAIDSYAIINSGKLSKEDVTSYLETMSKKSIDDDVWVLRKFRIPGKSFEYLSGNDEGRKILLNLALEVTKHLEMKFNPEVELYEANEDVNPFLDYVIITNGGKRKAFITSIRAIEKEGKYCGLEVWDQMVIDILMEDRFRHTTSYKNAKVFLEFVKSIKN